MILLFDMWIENVAYMVKQNQVSSLSDQYVNGEDNPNSLSAQLEAQKDNIYQIHKQYTGIHKTSKMKIGH